MDDYLASCIAKKSTAARKDVQRGTRERSTLVREVPGSHESESAKVAGARLSGESDPDAHQQAPETAPLIAGTQVLPVDTTPKRGKGRPRKHPDRKAYRAEWLRKDRRDHPEKYGKPAKATTIRSRTSAEQCRTATIHTEARDERF